MFHWFPKKGHLFMKLFHLVDEPKVLPFRSR